MRYNYGLHFTGEMVKRYGFLTEGWPASTQQLAPFFTIVVNAVGLERAASWFEAARHADCREREVEQACAYQFGFAIYLAEALDYHGQAPTLAETAAWEATSKLRADAQCWALRS
ncbi:hypothetical protein QF034_000032 [Streptomyces africanus]|uniref:Uncharacterized protein n=1 Tax=Streptomyces africanus TaxID=231024 RepID=A0ABU0QEI4_9ACTN|nr:hypothetical protein [Streptomyces africanus]MDQ0745801.1 hypothetical protein [Streptomyces africanus]